MAKIEHKILSSFVFVHSKLDDAGLSANEFRVYCHIARRAGAGMAFPSADSIASICRMNRKTVWTVIASLECRRMITRKARTGASNTYTLTLPEEWVTCLDRVDPIEGVTQKEYRGGDPNEVPGGDPNEVPRRVSIEGNPVEGNPHKGECGDEEEKQAPIQSVVWPIWQKLNAQGFGVKHLAWTPAMARMEVARRKECKGFDFADVVGYAIENMTENQWFYANNGEHQHRMTIIHLLTPQNFIRYTSNYTPKATPDE